MLNISKYVKVALSESQIQQINEIVINAMDKAKDVFSVNEIKFMYLKIYVAENGELSSHYNYDLAIERPYYPKCIYLDIFTDHVNFILSSPPKNDDINIIRQSENVYLIARKKDNQQQIFNTRI